MRVILSCCWEMMCVCFVFKPPLEQDIQCISEGGGGFVLDGGFTVWLQYGGNLWHLICLLGR